MRGRSLQRRAPLALVLGLAFAAGPATSPAHAECAELTLYATWNGTDPTGQSTTPVHNGCITETGATHGISYGESQNGNWTPTGTPSGYYLYVRVPIPFW